MLAAMADRARAGLLARITTPTLVMHGKADPLVPYACGEDTARRIPYAKLLGIEGYEGIKTGTTTPAGCCLAACGRRGDRRLIVVVLGSTSTEARYADARNLFRYAWQTLGVK
jgi:hypothetical protein